VRITLFCLTSIIVAFRLGAMGWDFEGLRWLFCWWIDGCLEDRGECYSRGFVSIHGESIGIVRGVYISASDIH
jgi:hypothetical protein